MDICGVMGNQQEALPGRKIGVKDNQKKGERYERSSKEHKINGKL
jgi:hypothetical protein